MRGSRWGLEAFLPVADVCPAPRQLQCGDSRGLCPQSLRSRGRGRKGWGAGSGRPPRPLAPAAGQQVVGAQQRLPGGKGRWAVSSVLWHRELGLQAAGLGGPCAVPSPTPVRVSGLWQPNQEMARLSHYRPGTRGLLLATPRPLRALNPPLSLRPRWPCCVCAPPGPSWTSLVATHIPIFALLGPSRGASSPCTLPNPRHRLPLASALTRLSRQRLQPHSSEIELLVLSLSF